MTNHRHLFIDDFHLSRIEGLKRTMHPAEKHPANPVIKSDRPWEHEGGPWARPGAYYDARERLCKMWYNSNAFGGHTGYATSTDGVHWEKPMLGLVEFERSKNNNIVESEGRVWQIVHDDHPPASLPAGCRHLGISWTAEKGQFIQTSADGLRWTTGRAIQFYGGDAITAVKAQACLTGPNPADLPASPTLPDQPRYVASNRWCVPVGRFDGSSKLRPTRRALMLYQSNDFLTWEKPLRILTPDERDDQMAHARIEAALADGSLATDCKEDRRCEFYDMTIVPYEDLYVGLMLVFDPSFQFTRVGGMNQSGPMEIQLVASRDLVDWQRLGDRQPFIPRGGPGQHDWAMAVFVSLPIVKDGKLWFYYTGACVIHGGNVEANLRDQRAADHYQMLRTKIASGELPGMNSIGLATVRRDGFVSLDAGHEAGYVLTKPFALPAAGVLHLNTDARGGEVRVALCQPDGTPYLGYEQSHPLTGDLLDAVVTWPKHGATEARSLDNLYTHETAAEAGTAQNNDYEKSRRLGPGKPVRLKITARNAKLYSYWFA